MRVSYCKLYYIWLDMTVDKELFRSVHFFEELHVHTCVYVCCSIVTLID